MLAKKRSILDVIATNGASVKRRVSKGDQEKMEEYFESLRDIEKGLKRQAEWSETPKPPAPFGAPEMDLLGEEEIRMMLDMIIIALQTDSTRVATYRFPIQSLLESLELSINAHTMSHYRSSASKKAASEARDQKLMEL